MYRSWFLVRMLREIPSNHIFAVLTIVVLIDCLDAVHVEDWAAIKAIPVSYYKISTENVLRCGKLCERQGRCTAVTFDGKARLCYMHADLIGNVGTNESHSGRYMFKNYQKSSMTSQCDKDTQIAVPSASLTTYRCSNLKDLNQCLSDPCQNGGTCTDEPGGYTCVCVAGYNGINCETDVNECLPAPCRNGGICIDVAGGYACACAASYNGINCETDIDECVPNPCPQFCNDTVNGYKCSCYDGYSGANCEKAIVGKNCSRTEDCIVPNSECQPRGVCGCMAGYGYKLGTLTCETGLIGLDCVESSDCAVMHSECRTEGVCGCIAGYSFQPGTQTCDAGLIGLDCVESSDCAVMHSECRTEGVCGCIAGYSFQPGTQTCDAGCTTYGNTFQVFNGHAIYGFNRDEFFEKTPEECARLCIDATGYVCLTFDMKLSDNNRCTLQEVDASDVGSDYAVYPQYIHYQRNCA